MESKMAFQLLASSFSLFMVSMEARLASVGRRDPVFRGSASVLRQSS